MRVCVYCGSKSGNDSAYQDAAHELGREIARREWGMVFGGGSVGLMGVVADAVLDAGGEVIGVIPKRLAHAELLHPRVDPMHVVEDMHSRKALMAETADAFIALPGGYGTFEELFEVVTWAQLGFHAKSTAILNVNGYFDHLLAFIDHSIAEGFVKADNRELMFVADNVKELAEQLEQHELPEVRVWK
jgi:uncharacterized protein (TIGR00730 family)